MTTIYKYPIEITDSQIIELPYLHKILHVGLDPNGVPCIWSAVDLHSSANTVIEILVAGTGTPLGLNYGSFKKHIGSFIQDLFVWHVFTKSETTVHKI